MIRRFLRWLEMRQSTSACFRVRQRQMDIEILWPAIKKEAGGDTPRAVAAFIFHASRDPAWLALGDKMVLTIEAELARVEK